MVVVHVVLHFAVIRQPHPYIAINIVIVITPSVIFLVFTNISIILVANNDNCRCIDRMCPCEFVDPDSSRTNRVRSYPPVVSLLSLLCHFDTGTALTQKRCLLCSYCTLFLSRFSAATLHQLCYTPSTIREYVPQDCCCIFNHSACC